MKLYVVPIENKCNASCPFCITRFKNEHGFGASLNIKCLDKIISLKNLDKIEITGGGESLLHPKINEIVDYCSTKAPTQLYSNGALIDKLKPEVSEKLKYFCLSRCHWDDSINGKTMNVSYSIRDISNLNTQIKMSLVLYKGLIDTLDKLMTYVFWAEGHGANEVVVRQMFDYDYPKEIKDNFVSTTELHNRYRNKYGFDAEHKTAQGNPVEKIYNINVEFELKTCACQLDNPVLRANGSIYKGWSNELYV